MRVHVGSDHAGFELKERLVGWLAAEGHQVVDHGAATFRDGDDYPPYCIRTAQAVVADAGSLGLVIGGSGNGEQIAANKVQGVRAALVWSPDTAELARRHNDANVVAIGARMHSPEEAQRLVGIFLATPFSGAERHRRRIGELADFERTGEVAGAADHPSDQPAG